MSEEINKEINEHIQALKEIAQIYKLPMFFSIVTDYTSTNTTYEKGVLSAQSLGIEIVDDKIKKHLLVEAGFEVIPPRETITMDMEELLENC